MKTQPRLERQTSPSQGRRIEELSLTMALVQSNIWSSCYSIVKFTCHFWSSQFAQAKEKKSYSTICQEKFRPSVKVQSRNKKGGSERRNSETLKFGNEKTRMLRIEACNECWMICGLKWSISADQTQSERHEGTQNIQTSCFIVVFCLSISYGKGKRQFNRGSVHGRDSIVRNNRSAFFCNSYDDIVRSVSKQSSASPSFDINSHQALSDHYETPLSPLSGTLSPLCLYCLIYQ